MLKKRPGRDWHRSDFARRRGCVESLGLQWNKSTQWKERHIGYALPREFANEAAVVPVRNI